MFPEEPRCHCKTGLRLSLRNLNIFRSGILRCCSQWLLVALALVCLANSARALSSHKAISQYIRDESRAEQGFPGGPEDAIGQTPDGYLWIGAGKGLVRVDGHHFGSFMAAECER